MYAGVDLGADRFHCVALDASAYVCDARALTSVQEVVAWAGQVAEIAVDAPATLSMGPHRADPDISPKFRYARCAEIALGRQMRIWVPWTTPTELDRSPRWMQVGFELFAALRRRGMDPIEVYPHGAFRLLAASRLAKKQSAAGAAARVSALRARGVRGGQLEMWSHDSVDALAAALVAKDRADGRAVRVSCDHDGSALWMPGV